MTETGLPPAPAPDQTESLLPATFAFSQSSLQAFVDCPRRFWLAYVEQLPWPAVEASPVQEHEAAMRQGALFHRLVERAEIGLDTELLAADLKPPLADWFDAYLRTRPADLPTDFLEIEKIFSIPFVTDRGRFRLAAKYDLIAAANDGPIAIVDWKTSRRRGDPAQLARRLQSQVYPYVLVEASKRFNWGPIGAHQVEMRYWFAGAPAQPVTLRYDGARHADNHTYLHALLDQILAGESEADFPKVPDTEENRRRLCSYCVYRSRCNRGQSAGELDEAADAEELFAVDLTSALEFTLDDVEELAF